MVPIGWERDRFIGQLNEVNMGTLMKENRKKEPMYITSMAYL